jgi:hypothetical protein
MLLITPPGLCSICSAHRISNGLRNARTTGAWHGRVLPPRVITPKQRANDGRLVFLFFAESEKRKSTIAAILYLLG